jgi:hypothetical protein
MSAQSNPVAGASSADRNEQARRERLEALHAQREAQRLFTGRVV